MGRFLGLSPKKAGFHTQMENKISNTIEREKELFLSRIACFNIYLENPKTKEKIFFVAYQKNKASFNIAKNSLRKLLAN